MRLNGVAAKLYVYVLYVPKGDQNMFNLYKNSSSHNIYRKVYRQNMLHDFIRHALFEHLCLFKTTNSFTQTNPYIPNSHTKHINT